MRHFAYTVFGIIFATAAMAQSSGVPTTQEQRQEVLRLAAAYPDNPGDPALDRLATASVKVLQAAPDIPVAICAEHLPWVEKKKYKYAHELTIAYFLGSGSYSIQHAGVRPSRVYYPGLLAGSAAAIRAYQVILQHDGSARLDKMSDWVDRQQSGKLIYYLVQKCLSPNPAMSRPKGPVTPEERQRIIAFAEELQQNPIDPALLPEYQELLIVIIQATDFTVVICSTPWMADKPEYKYGAEMLALDMMAMASYILRNPETAKDANAHNLAGLKVSLRGYEAILKQEPAAHSKALDNALALEKEGKLDSSVQCTKK